PFLDASTPARRRVLCEDECRLNGRLAAPVYLGVRPITREADGRLALDGTGPAVDHVVWMRRLPADRMLDRLVEDGAADAATLARLAPPLADFHARPTPAPTVAAHASPGASVAAPASPLALRRTWTDVLALAAPLVGGPLPRASHAILADFGPDFIARNSALLENRQTADRIREGHGDLRAEHVCLLDAPVPAIAP